MMRVGIASDHGGFAIENASGGAAASARGMKSWTSALIN